MSQYHPSARITEPTFIVGFPTRSSKAQPDALKLLKGIMWFGVAFGVVFVIARIAVRLNVFRRLWADDALTLFAWLLLLVNTILWQTGKDALYQNIAVSTGKALPPPTFPRDTEVYLRKTVAIIVFFYSGLWSVKFAFLLFFRRLGQNVKNQKVIWWVVLVVTASTYFACLGTIEYHCLADSFEYIAGGYIGIGK